MIWVGLVSLIHQWGNKMDKELYRKALHIYLIHAYPDDDMQYYSKWAWLAHPTLFWRSMIDNFPFPTEARFGCHASGNTKLRCYPTGFMFDMNCGGDSQEVIEELKTIKIKIENDWEEHGIPIHGGK